jgi:hypothetical protein
MAQFVASVILGFNKAKHSRIGGRGLLDQMFGEKGQSLTEAV